MSSLIELQILGVRAFDSQEFQRLKFRTPLTLICGANGVGKTTIIECLRYIATGDLPPNAKGGAFVHDPRMSSKQSVKAQVKLVFHSADGKMMQASRSMQLSYSSRGLPTFKTLDGYLTANTGSSHSNIVNSARHADLNSQVPQALGVPPAILNFVVFCHQEDSLWPLSEPSVVKKRFDEIFEATRYSKALEVFKTDRKAKLTDIKLQKAQVEHLQQDLDRAIARAQQLKSARSNLESLKSECETLQKSRTRANTELLRSVENSQTLQQLKFQVNDTEQRANRLLQDIDILSSEIKDDLSEQSDAQLYQQLDESAGRESQLKHEESELNTKKDEIESRMSIKRDQLAVLTNKQGRIEQLMEAHAKRLTEREELVEQNVVSNGSTFDTKMWREDRVSYLDSLKLDFERVELKNRQLEEELSQEVNSHEAHKLQLREIISTQRNEVRENHQKIAELNAQIAQLSDEGLDAIGLDALKSRLEQAIQDKTSAEIKYQEFGESNKLRTSEKDVHEAEFQAEEAHKVVQHAIDKSATQSRLNFLRDSEQDLKKNLEKNMNELWGNFSNEFPGELESEDTASLEQLDPAIRTKLSEQQRLIHQLAEKISHLKSQHKFLEASDLQIQKKIADLNIQYDTVVEALSSLNLGNDIQLYEAKLEEAEAALQSAIEDEEQLQFAHSYFQRGLEAASDPDHPVCQLCGHEKSADEAKKFISRLRDTIMKLSLSPEQSQEVTEQKRTFLEKLRKLQPQVNQYRHLAEEKRSLELEHKEGAEKMASVLQEIDQIEKHHEVESLRSTRCSSKFEPLLNQCVRIRDDLNGIEAKIGLESAILLPGDSFVSPREAQQKNELAQSALKDARAKFEAARAQSEQLKADLYQLSSVVKELKLKISESELKDSQKMQVKSQILQIEEAQGHAQRKLDEAQSSMPLVESEIDTSNTRLRGLKHEHAQVERQFAETRNAAAQVLKRFDNLSSEIIKFEEEHGSEPLQMLQQESQSIRDELETSKSELNDLNEKANNNTKLQSDFGSYRRNLKDNIRIKKFKKDHDRIMHELEAGRRNLAEAQRPDQDWEAVVRQLQDEVGELNHQISTKSGESKAITAQIEGIELELSTTYKDTSKSYRDSKILLSTTEQAADDLVKYVNALDAAIMKYHSIKMAEINALLDEMWRQTYKGTDIDTILIKSESDSNSSSSRASYNYRVCMIKQNTELDMRGRCSAGQKVLASILIRMVLAECFGHKSGLIVLDEPTTNLDVNNSNALAESLNEIINCRRGKQNFQLIVITHDENFLSQMRPAEYCEDYYQVRRNKQQLSTINNLPISSLR